MKLTGYRYAKKLKHFVGLLLNRFVPMTSPTSLVVTPIIRLIIYYLTTHIYLCFHHLLFLSSYFCIFYGFGLCTRLMLVLFSIYSNIIGTA